MDDLFRDMQDKGLAELVKQADIAERLRYQARSYMALLSACTWCKLLINGSELRKRMN